MFMQYKNLECFLESLNYNQIIELSVQLKNNKNDLEVGLNKILEKDKKKFDKIVNDEVIKFGLPDYMDYDSYFPCEFVEIIDKDRLIIKIYEPSIKKFHIVNIAEIVIIENNN